MFVLMGVSARTGRRVKGAMMVTCCNLELAAHGHDRLLNDNDERLLSIAIPIASSLSRPRSPGRNGGTSHTHSGANRRNDLTRIDYILTRNGYRPRVHTVMVPRQPPSSARAKAARNNLPGTVESLPQGTFAPSRQVRKAANHQHWYL